MSTHLHAHEVTVGLGFFLGALHAIEPGHGKTVVLVHMLDGRMSRWAPVTLGLSVAASHSASLLLIAAAVHWLTHALGGHAVEATVTHALQWTSACLIVAVGGWLLFRATQTPAGETACGCAAHRHDHADEDNTADPSGRHISLKTSALLGLAVGLLPCPSALAAYLTGLSSGDPARGYFVILAFGFGIAVSITAVGIGIHFLSRMTGRSLTGWEDRGNFLGIARACVILAVGVFYTGHLIS
ncbi:MAG: sulfite exporter TauE/SafE family protein [Planctomycetota bacterium]